MHPDRSALSSSPEKPQPSPGVRYALAAALSLFAWAFDRLLIAWLGPPAYPFLPGFLAVIVSAAWVGLGPGLFATALVTGWCGYILVGEQHSAPADAIVRCAIFAGEGLLLSIGSGRLKRISRDASRGAKWHRSLVDTSGEAIWVVDRDGVITYANPRAGEILGMEAVAMVGLPAERFFFPEDVTGERIRFRNRRLGVKEQFDRRLRRNDGAEVWVLACTNAMIDVWNQAPSVLSMMTDITERKRAEQALRRSEQRFRELFENVVEGVYQSTPRGEILAANPMLLRMLGMTSEAELNDVNIARDLYVDPGVRKRLLERLEQDGSFMNVEYELRRRDGRIITVEENARIIRDEDGSPLYYEGTLTDITERRQIEAQMYQAQKMEALGKLAGGIAHDFSNVVAAISGHANLLLHELPAGHAARSDAELVLEAAERASDLTKQLHSFSLRQTVTPVTIDVGRLLYRTRSAIEEVLGGVRLSVAPPQEPMAIIADQAHIEQIVMSLALSARNSVPEGSTLEMRVSAAWVDLSFRGRWPEARPGAYVVISVNGAMMPAGRGYRERAWADPAPDFPDLGGSMSTTQAIVTQYGGFVVADNEGHRGWTFSIYLPKAEGSVEFADRTSLDAESAAPRESILVVDDEPLMRELSRDILERQGYHVVVAGPAEVESICRAQSAFDLVITDVVMPRFSGPQVVRKLRARRPGLKVLFVSGYASYELDPEEFSPSDSFLQKPFSAESLSRKVRQMLDQG